MYSTGVRKNGRGRDRAGEAEEEKATGGKEKTREGKENQGKGKAGERNWDNEDKMVHYSPRKNSWGYKKVTRL